MLDRCPDCGGEHSEEPQFSADFSSYGKEQAKRFDEFFNDKDLEKRATKIGTLTYLARAVDTLPEGKRIINQAVYVDYVNLKVQYLLEKPKQGWLLLQIGYKQFAGTLIPELAICFYKEMQLLRDIYKSNPKEITLYKGFYDLPGEKIEVEQTAAKVKEQEKPQEQSNVSTTGDFAKAGIVLYTNYSSGITPSAAIELGEAEAQDIANEVVKRVAKKLFPEDNSEQQRGQKRK